MSRHNIPISRQLYPPQAPMASHHPHHPHQQPYQNDPFGNNFRDMTLRDNPFPVDPRDAYGNTFYQHPQPVQQMQPVPYQPVYHQPPQQYPAPTGPISMNFFNPERQMNAMDNEMQKMGQEMKRVFSDVQHLMPVDANPESWRTKENFLMDNPIQHDRVTGERMFRLQFDVRQFKPDEIFVNTVGDQLTIHAKHAEKSEGKSMNREYHRQYILPKDLNPEHLQSKLNRDGVLVIEAPLPAIEGEQRGRMIPIKHTK